MKQGSFQVSSENLSSAQTQSSVDKNNVPIKKQSASVGTDDLLQIEPISNPVPQPEPEPEPVKKTTSTGTSPLPQDISTQVTSIFSKYLKFLTHFSLDLRRRGSGKRKENQHDCF